MAIPEEDVAKVRAATDIVALIGEHTALKRVGRRFVGLCPFHGEKTPSFSVNAEEGLYYCFGCQASGDAISFVRAIEACDFIEAVERLAARAGIAIRNDADSSNDLARSKRQKLHDAMAAAAEHYHNFLLSNPKAGRARQYLRSRGYDGEIVRSFKIGFAPDAYDELVKALKLPPSVLIEAGLAYENSQNRLQDAFRERVIFPIFDPGNKVIALGGRVLPENYRTSTREPGPKYRNSPESPIYQKRSTLYGLNFAKANISKADEVIVCEGYTDVIGFFVAGLPRAVATCGTALTEDHFRLLARFAKKVVLAFDADNAGQNAAARIYEWEKRHQVELKVAAMPPGSDPAELAQHDPESLRASIASAKPFLGFHVERALSSRDLSTPEGRTRAAEDAIAIIAEHPNELVLDPYVVMVADRTRHDPAALRALLASRRKALARNGDQSPELSAALGSPRSTRSERSFSRASRDALLLAIHRPHEVGALLNESLFVDPGERDAYRALVAHTNLYDAIASSEPATAQLLSRLAASDVADELDAEGTCIELIRAAVDRVISDINARGRQADGQESVLREGLATTSWLKLELENLRDPVLVPGDASSAVQAAERLLAWLSSRQQSGE
jgi:DNA primase